MLETTDANPASEMPALPLRLTRQRREAGQIIKNQIKIGGAIKSQRMVYVEDLEEARAEKQEWVQRTTEMLKQLFSDGSVAEQCNDWVGPILPEYAEFELFAEQFEREMKHRIARLQALLKRLDDFPEPEKPATPEKPPMSTTVAQRLAPPAPTRKSDSIVLLLAPGLDEGRRKNITEFLQALGLSAHAIEIPPDGGEDWRLPLARQLKSAGVAVDLNRLI